MIQAALAAAIVVGLLGLFAFIAAKIGQWAALKGRSFWAFFWLSLLITPIITGLIVATMTPAPNSIASQTRLCPQCMQSIPRGVTQCRFCGFDTPVDQIQTPEKVIATIKQTNKRPASAHVVLWVGLSISMIVLVIGLFGVFPLIFVSIAITFAVSFWSDAIAKKHRKRLVAEAQETATQVVQERETAHAPPPAPAPEPAPATKIAKFCGACGQLRLQALPYCGQCGTKFSN